MTIKHLCRLLILRKNLKTTHTFINLLFPVIKITGNSENECRLGKSSYLSCPAANIPLWISSNSRPCFHDNTITVFASKLWAIRLKLLNRSQSLRKNYERLYTTDIRLFRIRSVSRVTFQASSTESLSSFSSTFLMSLIQSKTVLRPWVRGFASRYLRASLAE